MPGDQSPQNLTAVPTPVTLASLSEYYSQETGRIRQQFDQGGDGKQVLKDRSDLVDSVILRLYRDLISPAPQGPPGLCLLALGGYGRRELFPQSDIDLLFHRRRRRRNRSSRIHCDAAAHAVGYAERGSQHPHARGMWTAPSRQSGVQHRRAGRELSGGGSNLYARLHEDVVPHLVARDRDDLVRNLIKLTERRHAKHGNTIFHLEPNLKDSPGGLRDLHVCRWLVRIDELEKNGRWTNAEDLWPGRDRASAQSAFEFLADARCFLHYLRGRNDNHLTYEAQAEAAARGVGMKLGQGLAPEDWMRNYFRKIRVIDRLTEQRIEEAAPSSSSLYGLYTEWRSRFSNADFSVVRTASSPASPPPLSANPICCCACLKWWRGMGCL